MVVGHSQGVRRGADTVEHQRVTLPAIDKCRSENGTQRIVGARRGECDPSTAGGDERPESIEPFLAPVGGSEFLGLRPHAMRFPEHVGLARRGRKKAVADDIFTGGAHDDGMMRDRHPRPEIAIEGTRWGLKGLLQVPAEILSRIDVGLSGCGPAGRAHYE